MLTDYDDKTHVLKIDSFRIHLPDKLSQQLNQYVNIRKRVLEKNKSSCLEMFITANGKPLNDNGRKYFALKNLVNDYQSESISMRAIINMLKIGIPIGYIQILTGFSEDTCNLCFEYLRQEESYECSEINRMIDSKLRLLPIYDEL